MSDTPAISDIPDAEEDRRAGKSAESDMPARPIALDWGKESLVLPPPDTRRWSSRRKAAVVVGARAGVITREEACARYQLSEEELAAWETAFDRRGIPGLRAASLQSYRTVRAKS